MSQLLPQTEPSLTDIRWRLEALEMELCNLRALFTWAAERGQDSGPDHLAHQEALSDREREVAALIARGLTNRQIAAALLITTQTANKHVSNILGKLALSTRSQVAVWVTQHRAG